MRYVIVDLRTEFAEYERKFRPFPPCSGSVSKPIPRFHRVVSKKEEFYRWHAVRLQLDERDSPLAFKEFKIAS